MARLIFTDWSSWFRVGITTKNIHVAVHVRCAVGVGAKEDDLVGLKLLGDLTSKATD